MVTCLPHCLAGNLMPHAPAAVTVTLFASQELDQVQFSLPADVVNESCKKNFVYPAPLI